MEEEKGMTRGQSGEVRQREAAPAIVDLKPQSCLWLILPESGGGAKGPDGVQLKRRLLRAAGNWSNLFSMRNINTTYIFMTVVIRFQIPKHFRSYSGIHHRSMA